ncbi:MAG: cardiolipin synthase [Rhodobacteraceae bacterium]|nr:cardiolipin synthase [Paracoccaceae bacterium]
MSTTTIFLIAHFCLVVVTILRVMLRSHREPAARIAWIAVITSLPILGIIAYILLGEVDIGRKHVARMRQVLTEMPDIASVAPKGGADDQGEISQQYRHIFKLGKSISGFDPVGGNSARLMESSSAMIDALVTDIDAAKNHVHVLFYIWLPDNSGRKVVEALKRAATRGITCRAMADNMGSRTMIKSEHWRAMQKCGVHLAVLLPMFTRLSGRIDLRNHRKIIVIDDAITYCGSQNCADAEFLPKPDFAPWVDAVLRLEGPIVRQNQHLFISDWMAATDEDITSMLTLPMASPQAGFSAQVVGTGPTDRHFAMSQIFVALIASARKELIITTPYFVPDEPIQSALQAASYRGVKTIIVLPQKNDSRIVQGASRSYYAELLEAGIQIFEFREGLLHTKSLTIDGEFTMIGSANMDRRSFDLNYENNILIQNQELTADIIARQREYISKSNQVNLDTVNSWSITTRLLNNTVAVLGPIL